MPSDTSERGLEELIVDSLVNQASYELGKANDFDRDYAIDLKKLLAFLQVTQPQVVEQLRLTEEGQARELFLNRLQGEITKRGIIDVLRKGIKHGPASID